MSPAAPRNGPTSRVSRHCARRRVATAAVACSVAATLAGANAEGADAPPRPVLGRTGRLFVLSADARVPRPVAGVSRYTFLSSPQYSGDGRELAFTAQRCPRCAHLLAVASARGVRLVSRNALRVVWYPRARRLLFVHVSRHGTTLYAVGADGRRFSRVAAERDSDGVSSFDTPDVAPDGKRIVYAREIEPIESRELFVRDLATGRARTITPLPLWSLEPDFSPDGTQIAFSCQLRTMSYGICLIGADGSGRRVLTRGPEDHDPTFAPDGRTIVFSSTRGRAAFGIRSLWSVGVDGRGLRRLTSGADDSEPAFAPTGKRLVFVRRDVHHVIVPTG